MTFQSFWQIYPKKGRLQKKKSEAKFIRNVKNVVQFDQALKKYLLFLEEPHNKDWLQPKHFITFLTDWEDWLDYEVEEKQLDLRDRLRGVFD